MQNQNESLNEKETSARSQSKIIICQLNERVIIPHHQLVDIKRRNWDQGRSMIFYQDKLRNYHQKKFLPQTTISHWQQRKS